MLLSRSRLVAAITAGLLTTGGLMFGSANANAADAYLYASYPVTGTTTIASTSSTMDLGPATLQSTLDVTTDGITANLALPPATGSFTELGIVPVTATTAFIQDGPITGKDVNGGITTTAYETLQLTNITVAGIPVPVGTTCESATPAELDLVSDSGFNVLTGGNISGTYTIPQFTGCGLLLDPILNALIPGPNNTITLTLAKPTISLTPPTS